MVDFVELKYATMLSNRLERFKIKNTNPYKINFRCHVCGDSQKSKIKARGWLLESNTTHTFTYFCHNCGVSQSFTNFLKNLDNMLYNDYITEKYIDKRKSEEKIVTKQENSFTTPKPVFGDPLQKIKKISQLSADHPVKQYIQKRQIPSAQHYRLYYAPKFMTWINSIIPNKFEKFEKDHPRLILPFIDEKGKCFGVSARGFDPNGLRYISIMFEDKPKIFGLDKVNFNKKYYIVEGALDSLFLNNAIAMAGADGNTHFLPANGVFVFDNEPRNKEIHKRIEKLIRDGKSVCIWPSNIQQKDINDMILAGLQNIEKIIDANTFTGLEAKLKLMSWRKV
jgi:transcription elongation factor Elf1